MGPSVCARKRAYVFVSVCACGSVQRLIHNDDRKYSIISSHSVIFTKQRGGERERERGAGGKETGERQSGGRVKEMKVESHTKTDRDG